MKNVASKINLALMRLQWKMKLYLFYRLSKNTEQSEYMWWPHMAFFLEIRWKSSKTIRTLFRKSWCPTPCHNLPTKLFYLNICTSSISVVIFYFFTKAHCQFSRFLFIPFPDIFLVKKLQHIFFCEIAMFTSRLLSFDDFVSTCSWLLIFLWV